MDDGPRGDEVTQPMGRPAAGRAWSRRTRVAVGAGAASAVLLACLAVALLAAPGAATTGHTAAAATATTVPTATLAPAPTATATVAGTPTPTPRPTATPKPTATPGPQAVSGPYLGGTQADYTAAFGQPTIVAGNTPHYAASVGGQSADISIYFEGGKDGQQRVWDLVADPADGSAWDDATKAAVCGTLMPGDATHVRDDQDSQLGTLHVYRSADLGATFPAAEFNQTSAQPAGTFTMSNDAPGEAGCQILTGE